MATGALLTRMIVYGLALSAIDAVSGRMLQASPDPSVVLALGATAWAAFRVAGSGRAPMAIPAGLTLWIAFLGGFVVCARILVGWNGSAPWRLPGTTWLAGFAACAIGAAVA